MQSYNFGLSISPTGVRINSTPISVAWGEDNLTATVNFKIQLSPAATTPPIPQISGLKYPDNDIYGLSINSKADQNTISNWIF